VHYVIDYYFNPAGDANAPAKPDAVFPPKLTRAIYVDVRPAVDDVTAVVDRLRLLPQRLAEAWDRPRFRADGIDPRSQSKPEQVHSSEAEAAPPPAASGPTRAAAAPPPAWVTEMDVKCKPLLDRLRGAAGDDDRRSATLALNYCMGRVACPPEAAAFMKVLEANAAAGTAGAAGGEEEAAFDRMSTCVMARLRGAGREGVGAGGAAPQPPARMQ
jgi:hypothetical protein